MTERIADHGCITCGDVAIAMLVLQVDLARGLALCASKSGERETVETALVESVDVGQWLLVHAGTALSLVVDDEVAYADRATVTSAEPVISSDQEAITSARRDAVMSTKSEAVV